MTLFVDLPGILPEFIALNRSRCLAAGLDPFAYDRATAPLTSLREWPAAFLAVAEEHRAAADRYAADGRTVSAGEAYRDAARWFHCAVPGPYPDRVLLARAADAADRSMRAALALLEPRAARVEGEEFAGWLRFPAAPTTSAARPPVVVLVPGLDSGKEEFHAVADALLARGAAVFAMDGPGQGVFAASRAPHADYQHVVSAAIDALAARGDVDTGRLGVCGLSLGGFYASVAAAHDPRIRAALTVSGPYRLQPDELPQYVTETLALRCGGADAAREFASRVDLRGVAQRIACPLRVVEGGQDVTPGVVNAEQLSHEAPRATYDLVPHGDHLLGNARAEWLPGAADWMLDRLDGDNRETGLG
ncbi:alpha/beta hydrolase family protein [Streptomyces sp. Da 82-17]|uniref:alpha/beta hydrolase family protein n=1 Tax=Streptomyces sp. Da 82-17 TaxID=3377116 RepID=UPI0038D3B2FF